MRLTMLILLLALGCNQSHTTGHHLPTEHEHDSPVPEPTPEPTPDPEPEPESCDLSGALEFYLKEDGDDDDDDDDDDYEIVTYLLSGTVIFNEDGADISAEGEVITVTLHLLTGDQRDYLLDPVGQEVIGSEGEVLHLISDGPLRLRHGRLRGKLFFFDTDGAFLGRARLDVDLGCVE